MSWHLVERKAGDRVRLRQLRRRCRDLLQELGVQEPLEVGDLAAKLSASRGRPLRLIERGAEVGSFGCLIPMPHEDLIVYHASSNVEFKHIVFHEIAHVFLNHLEPGAAETALVCGFEVAEAADRERDGVSGMYETSTEWEAETAATILSEWSSSAARKRGRVQRPGADPVLEQVNSAFGDLKGWRW